jgi:hypothetical protein
MKQLQSGSVEVASSQRASNLAAVEWEDDPGSDMDGNNGNDAEEFRIKGLKKSLVCPISQARLVEPFKKYAAV